MKVGIIQSNYIPWRGYFDIINEVDLFIFIDDILYSKGSWRNRNRIKTPKGSTWITVPVQQKSLSKTAIDQVSINKHDWQKDHHHQFCLYYESAPHFDKYRELLDEFYLGQKWCKLSAMNQFTIKRLSELLGVRTEFVNARDIGATGLKDDRVIQLLQHVGATDYLSGPAARQYIEPEKYAAAGITIHWKKYDYPEYPQLYPPFDGQVSILDLLFMADKAAPQYIWS